MSKILVKVLQRSVTWVLNWSGGWREDSVARWNVCVCTFVEEMWSNLICSFLEFFLTGGTKRYVHFNVFMVLTQNIGKYVEESCYFCDVLLGVNWLESRTPSWEFGNDLNTELLFKLASHGAESFPF